MGAESVYYIRALTLVYAKEGSTKTYYRFNGHGDVIALANASGAVIKRYKYDAFGVEESPDVFDTNVFRYCAEYYDIETKTVYLRARYYDAETGRFTQQDGWEYAEAGDALSLNLYVYCNNDPIKYTDPSGHLPISPSFRLIDKVTNARLEIGSVLTCIFGQAVDERVKDMKLGNDKMSKCGCEAIALYNARVLTEDPVPIKDVVNWCEENALWHKGHWGCRSGPLPKYFESLDDYETHIMSKEQIKNAKQSKYSQINTLLDECDVTIITFWNKPVKIFKKDIFEKNIFSGIHTVAVQKNEDGKILVYNHNNFSTEVRDFDSVSEYLSKKGSLINCFGVSRKRGDK